MILNLKIIAHKKIKKLLGVPTLYGSKESVGEKLISFFVDFGLTKLLYLSQTVIILITIS